MAPDGDIVYLGERIDALRETVSETARGTHGHIDRVEAAIKDAMSPPKFYVKPLKFACYVGICVVAIGILGWYAKTSLLPEGYLERFMDAGLNAVERME